MLHGWIERVCKDCKYAWAAALLLLVAPQLAWSSEIVLIGVPDISANPVSASYDGTLFTATGAPDNLKTSGGDTLISNSSMDVSFGVSGAGVVDSSIGGVDVGGTLYDIVIRGATGGGFPPPPQSDLFLADVIAFDRIAGNGSTIVFTAVAKAGQFVTDGTFSVGQQVGFIANIGYGANAWTGATFTNLQGTVDVAPYQFSQQVPAPGGAWLMLIAGAALARRLRRAAGTQ